MTKEISLRQRGTRVSLDRSLEDAASIITKSYLDKLVTYEINKPCADDIDIDALECGAFYQLNRLVHNRDENFLDKLTTIVDVVFSIESSLVTIINSDGASIHYYIGILSKKYRRDTPGDRARRNADKTAFRGALSGNLLGSDMEELDRNGFVKVQRDVWGIGNGKSISAVSGIVGLRDNENFSVESYVQGIENLVDSLQGVKYSIMMIADPVTTNEIQVIKQGYEILHSHLSAFRRSSMTVSENDAVSISKARTEGITKGISTGIAMTQSKTMSNTKFHSVGANFGISLGISAGINVTGGSSRGEQKTNGRTDTTTKTNQQNWSKTDTVGSSKTMGKSLELTYENRTVQALQDKIDKYLERLDNCESFGAFDCAAYCLADTKEEVLAVASNYNALLRGANSGIQASHINTWYRDEETEAISLYLKSFVHPRFFKKEQKEEDDKVLVSPSSIISGNELAIQVGFPKKSVSGISVISMASFGRNMPTTDTESSIALGSLYHMGRIDGKNSRVRLDVNGLTMHTFITGSTGTGKSTLIYGLLENLRRMETTNMRNQRIKFLVIEPAKGEYKHRFGNDEDVFVYGTNADQTPLLQINPFSFPDGIHVLEHIDRLIEIFNVCWPMYAAMPAVLKAAIERAYTMSGWNLSASRCKYQNAAGGKLYPSFGDVLKQIHLVMDDSDYSSESKGDYKGALCTRIKSLANGIYGQIFVANEIPSKRLFDENVIVDLSRIGSGESKSLIMGILVMKLQEYRMSAGEEMNLPLRHVTVLEEAHHILKRVSSNQSMESANVAGKSVEMLANSIAEMRTYGEGFIIADQSPGLMDMSVIRNTNTKIILRLPDRSDRELVGQASGMNEEQIVEIARFPAFVASVYQNNWLEPVLCRIEPVFKKQERYRYPRQNNEKDQKLKEYVKLMLLPIRKRNELDRKYVDGLLEGIYYLPVDAETKVAFIRYLTAKDKEEIQKYRSKSLYGLFHAESLFETARNLEKNFVSWYDHIYEGLMPDISFLDKSEQKKLIANLAMENAAQRENSEANDLFENVMKHLC